MRPTRAQLVIPHPLWIDFFPLGQVRDEFILRPELRNLNWLCAYDTLQISWPATVQDAVEPSPEGQGGPVIIKQAFIEHIDDVDAMTIAESALAHFPSLEGLIRTRSV